MEKKKHKKKSKAVEDEKPKTAVVPPNYDEEKPFDFGGLPSRDLKKNLGCG